MSEPTRERPSDVRSITDEPGVHAPKRRQKSAFFYHVEIESLISQRTIPKMSKMSFRCTVLAFYADTFVCAFEKLAPACWCRS